MKNTPLVLWLLALLLLTACAAPPAASGVPPAAPPVQAQPSPSSEPSGPASPEPEEDPEEPPEEEPLWYGTWTVTGEAAACPITALSQEEIDALTGAAVTYSAESFAAPGQELCTDPVYTEERTTAGELSSSFQVDPADLGLPEGEVGTLSVNNGWGLGSFAAVKDENTLLLYLDGVWFTAVRES